MNTFFFIVSPTLIGMLIFITSTAPAFAPDNTKKIKIAIIDTGMDLSHDLLKNNVWSNPGETGVDEHGNNKATNKIDDDGNGLVDDINGWDFAANTSVVTDTDGHGTHIAGIIKNNITQANAEVRFEFVVLKYFIKGMSYKEQQKAFLKSLKYAIDAKADIINISAGGKFKNPIEFDLLQKAQRLGIKIVAAAGNKRVGDRDYNFYPAAYEYSNILSVVATDSRGQILHTSNQNHNKSNTFATGNMIYSALPNNKFGYKTGSSQAAAVVTASVACQVHVSFKDQKEDLHKSKMASVTNSSDLLHDL